MDVEVGLPQHAGKPLNRAVRKPKGYAVDQPGDLVQVDTLDVRPVPGVVLKHFTARDIVSRWDVLEAHTRATATTAARFLDRLVARMPFPVHAIQVDGGPEFQGAFEEACQAHGIRLFVLPPRSPKLSGCVERAQRTHTEEFYEVTPFSLEIVALNRELLAWEAPTTPSGRTRPSAISPRPSSSTDGQLSERRPSVTNVPNEYKPLTRKRRRSMGAPISKTKRAISAGYRNVRRSL